MRPWIGIVLGHDDQERWRAGRDYLYGYLAVMDRIDRTTLPVSTAHVECTEFEDNGT